jgi:hypothetical protein
MECRLAGETEVLGENLPERHFCPSQNPTWPDPRLNPGRLGGNPATNRLSYGAAFVNAVDRCPCEARVVPEWSLCCVYLEPSAAHVPSCFVKVWNSQESTVKRKENTMILCSN